MLIAKREDSQYTQRRTAEQVTLPKVAEKVHTQSDLPTRIREEEPVIRKVASKPSSLASFNEDLEKEIDTTNLKGHIPKEHHAYLNIFSKQ